LTDEVKRITLKLGEQGGEIKEEIAPNLNFQTDRMMLAIALEKLIENAFFFRKDDAVGAGQHRVTLRAYRKEAQVIVEVEDNGVGIDPAAMADLFKMFSRGTERSKGSGLGLFIVRKAVDRLGGEVGIESEKGEYTIVRMVFAG
jgi:signal transduction histidine kinase